MVDLLNGIIPALVSPQDPSGQVLYDEVEKLAAGLVDQGATGVLVNGHTGELHQLTGNERRSTVQRASEALGSTRVVVAGIHAQSPNQFGRQADGAAEAGATHILAFPPYLLRRGGFTGTPQAVFSYYETINHLSPLPLIVMQMRETTQFMMGERLLDEILGLDQVVALKQEVEDNVHYESNYVLVKDHHPDVAILTASHRNMVGNLAVGADGCLAGLANFVGVMTEMLSASRSGDLLALRRWGTVLYPMAHAIYDGPGLRSIARLKYATFLLGFISEFTTRPPLQHVDMDEQKTIDAAFGQIEAAT